MFYITIFQSLCQKENRFILTKMKYLLNNIKINLFYDSITIIFVIIYIILIYDTIKYSIDYK